MSNTAPRTPVAQDATDEGYLIVEKNLLAPETWKFSVMAPMVAIGMRAHQGKDFGEGLHRAGQVTIIVN